MVAFVPGASLCRTEAGRRRQSDAVGRQPNTESGVFERSLVAALGIGLGGGAVLLFVGATVSLNWRGWAAKYTALTDAWWPPWTRRSHLNKVRTNRLALVMLAVIGVVLIITGVIAALRH